MLPVASSDVIISSLDDGAVLFSSKDEVYYGLNAVGLRVWQLLPPARRTLDELCAELQQEFVGVDYDTLAADVSELLGELTRFGLVVYPAGH